jgi:hypothetical protein
MQAKRSWQVKSVAQKQAWAFAVQSVDRTAYGDHCVACMLMWQVHHPLHSCCAELDQATHFNITQSANVSPSHSALPWWIMLLSSSAAHWR